MIALALWCAVLSTSLADPTARPEMVIRLTVDAMAAPKPALRYLLLPELREMSPGNPIPNYLKCLLDQDFSAPEEKLGRAALKQADRAARMDKPDWQILPKLRTDGVMLLLPDLQRMRFLAQELQGRFRNEVEQRRFEDALVSAKTMFALARHMGEHPTLIGDLVGIAIAQVAIGPLEEMLAQPGCPNLYWALTNLPHPLISIEKGMEGERMFVQAELRDLKSEQPMTADEIKKLVQHIDTIRAFEPDKLEKTRAWLDARNQDEKYLGHARARLIEYGLDKDRLAAFPADQVLLLDEKRAYEVERDEGIKLMSLPTWQALEYMEKLNPKTEPGLFSGFITAVYKFRRAPGRLEQRLAMLRHVEALRLFAASHEGKLPEKLAEVEVPLPVDPFTGKPFRYELKEGTAHIRGNPPRAEERNASYNLHYEITIRK